MCHGPTGYGNGPAARFLDVPVPSLAQIAQRDGRFKDTHVKAHVIYRTDQAATMTDWNEIFRNNYQSDALAQIALHNLVDHVERLQLVNARR